MYQIRFQEVRDVLDVAVIDRRQYCGNYFKKGKSFLPLDGEESEIHSYEEIVSSAIGVPKEFFDDAGEIIGSITESLDDDMSVAFAYAAGVLYIRIFDGEKYVFPLPILLTDNADAEMAALDTFDPAYTAVVDRRFAELIDDTAVTHTEGDNIVLTSYKPNELRYKSSATQPRVAVFSEIYFPWGWQVTIDGKEVKEARANYVLRALNIPAGEHEIVFRFDPQSLAVTENIAFASIAAIFLLLIAAVAVPAVARKRCAKA